jgi:tetratricopeptide (TPR) repeat protein
VVYFTRERSPAPVAAIGEEKDHRQQEEQQRLEQEQKRLDQDRANLEQKKRELEFTRLKEQGQAALAKQRYEEAEKAFIDALKLRPGDTEVVNGLVEARTARATAAHAKKENKPQEEVQRLLAQGREAMASKQYAAALRAFDSACQVAPRDAEATKGRTEAQDALERDETEKKKLADYQLHMKAGQVAMMAQRYQDAIREYLAAQQVIPGDFAAVLAQRQAENLIAAVQNQDKRRAMYTDLMERARTALREKRYDQATDALATALQLFPGDADATKALREVKQALAVAKADYNRFMTQGNIALAAQRLEEAVRNFQEASRALPGDPLAAKAQGEAEQALANVQAGQGAYLRYMTQGAVALQAKRYADALVAYTEALRLVPNDPTAVQGLQEARQALQDVKATADLAAQNRAQYDKQMRLAANAMTAHLWLDAIRAYTAALQAVPDDPTATAGLHKAKYSKAMADGHKALTARRQAEAISAFEDALKEAPNDIPAQRGLQQAKMLKK